MPKLQTLVTGLALGESPRWHAGRLWLSDWGAQEIIAVDRDGEREVILHIPTMPFCIDWLPDGRLLVVSGGTGVLLRREADGSLATHANLSSISNKPWNEIVVDGRGNAYVNTIGFDFPAGEFATGAIALVGPDGAVRQVADGLAFPNGMAVTPDNSTLIVAESYGFACMLGGADAPTLFIVAAVWGGPASMDDGQRTGQVLAIEAPAPHAGWS
jgi:sugar lactone lactonase YvrE